MTTTSDHAGFDGFRVATFPGTQFLGRKPCSRLEEIWSRAVWILRHDKRFGILFDDIVRNYYGLSDRPWPDILNHFNKGGCPVDIVILLQNPFHAFCDSSSSLQNHSYIYVDEGLVDALEAMPISMCFPSPLCSCADEHL